MHGRDMYTSLFDVFSIGIGPSSSHTMGPMRAAAQFVAELAERGLTGQTREVRVELYGSLALTGEGHGTPGAVIYGLLGLEAESLNLAIDYISKVSSSGQLTLGGQHTIDFRPERHISLRKDITLPEHPNGMQLQALGEDGGVLYSEVYFSIGGGAVRRRSRTSSTEVRRGDLWVITVENALFA